MIIKINLSNLLQKSFEPAAAIERTQQAGVFQCFAAAQHYDL